MLETINSFCLTENVKNRHCNSHKLTLAYTRTCIHFPLPPLPFPSCRVAHPTRASISPRKPVFASRHLQLYGPFTLRALKVDGGMGSPSTSLPYSELQQDGESRFLSDRAFVVAQHKALDNVALLQFGNDSCKILRELQLQESADITYSEFIVRSKFCARLRYTISLSFSPP